MEDEDESDKLQRLLSQLSELPVVSKDVDGNVNSILKFLFSVDDGFPTAAVTTDQIQHHHKKGYTDLLTEIRKLLTSPNDTLSPLDVHAVVSQALVWCHRDDDQNPPFNDENAEGGGGNTSVFVSRCICIGILSWALQRSDRPTKRWYSCTCETVRLFQRYFGLLDNGGSEDYGCDDDVESVVVSLWVNYCVPACRHVPVEDPKRQGAIFSGLVSTTIELILRYQADDDNPEVTIPLVEVLVQIAPSMDMVLLHPWCLANSQKTTKMDYAVFMSADQTWEDSVAFWSIMDESDEDEDAQDFVVSMKTMWDPNGLALLASAAFPYRPQVWSTSHVWKCWFPHIPALGNLDPMKAGKLLSDLIDQTPVESLTRSSQPLEAWINVSQSLSKDPITLRRLFKCYNCIDQVWLLQKLCNDSQDVMKPRWVDCMRDVVGWTDNSALEQIWQWWMDVLEDKETSIEVQMSVVGLARRWVLERNKRPPLPDFQQRIRASRERHQEEGNFDLLTLAFEQLEESFLNLNN
jgi:hypothetical protein